MDHLVVLATQCTFSLFVFSLIIKWYVMPKITAETKFDVLALLLLIHVFRYIPLSLFMPGQVSTSFPLYLKKIVAYGDFLSGILALIALVLLKANKSVALKFVWLFSIVSIIDIAVVLSLAMSEKAYELPLGANYFTVSIYVPMLIVIQLLILKIIFNKPLSQNKSIKI